MAKAKRWNGNKDEGRKPEKEEEGGIANENWKAARCVGERNVRSKNARAANRMLGCSAIG